MKKEFTSYKLALKMKKIGFDDQCFGYYESQDKYLVINYNNQLTEEQTKRPGLYITDNRNSTLPQWAVSAPTYSQAFNWFRDNHRIVSVISFYNNGEEWEDTEYKVTISEFEHFDTHDTFVKSEFNDYYKARQRCLEELIKIIESKQKK
jgi:hypothetical protein